jgi:predicted HTH transcriptional regulator
MKMPKSIIQKPLAGIGWSDIEAACADQLPEGPELEFKRALPAKTGRKDLWLESGQGVGEYARNEIAKEILAFANTYGGTVVVGIEETADKPNRAKGPSLLPKVHELARRLRQSIYDVIDPPLTALEAVGVTPAENETSGVVFIRVPVSRRRPHRLNANKEIYIRRADESVSIDMRQVHELTIHSLAESRRVEEELRHRRMLFEQRAHEWFGTERFLNLLLIVFPSVPSRKRVMGFSF